MYQILRLLTPSFYTGNICIELLPIGPSRRRCVRAGASARRIENGRPALKENWLLRGGYASVHGAGHGSLFLSNFLVYAPLIGARFLQPFRKLLSLFQLTHSTKALSGQRINALVFPA